jgi:hypothetical protein
MIILGVGIVAALIGIFVLMPYVMAATTIFYDMINGNLRPESDELPPLSQVNLMRQLLQTTLKARRLKILQLNYLKLKLTIIMILLM